jgi:hypothetical protein
MTTNPNTQNIAIAAITVTHEAADIWSAYAAAEISRDSIRRDYQAAVDEHAAMCDAIGDKLNDGAISLSLARTAWDECDAKLKTASAKRDTALAIADECDGVQA